MKKLLIAALFTFSLNSFASTLQGPVYHVMAPGGETTGTAIQTNTGMQEVDLAAAHIDASTLRDGETIVVQGSMTQVQGIEFRAMRNVFKAVQFSFLSNPTEAPACEQGFQPKEINGAQILWACQQN